MSNFTDAEIDEQISVYKTALQKYQEALVAIADPAIGTYYIHTGHGRQWVTQLDIVKVREMIIFLEHQIDYYKSLKSGNSGFIGTLWN